MEEEIKLFFILILTLCTLFKFKTTWKSTHRLAPITHTQQTELDGLAIDCEEDELQTRLDALALTQIDNDIFPPALPRRVVERSKATSGVGVTYRRTMAGESSCDSQLTVVYNSSYFSKNPFGSSFRPILSNEEHVRRVRHLLADPQVLPESNKMSVEENLQRVTLPSIVTVPKVKNIHKRKRFGKRALSSSRPPVDLLRVQEREPLLDIEREIKRRYQEIKLLKRMKGRR